MHVADLEARAFAVEAARPKGGEAALVRHLRQRIDLIHELRELAAGKEIPNDRRERLRVDQFCGVIESTLWSYRVIRSRTRRSGAGEAHAALVGEEFAHGPHPAAAQVIDVIHHAIAALEADEVFGRNDDVFCRENPVLQAGLQTQLLVDLVAADAAEVVPLGSKNSRLSRPWRGRRRRFAGAQAL